ncbi:MAG: hypothetical protein KDG89_11700 [Geminicoccaceae bacterium]|nr:hypothetical protein [Geminicoccaceae bacterium]
MRLGLATLALHPRRVPAAASPPSPPSPPPPPPPPPAAGAGVVGIASTPRSGTHADQTVAHDQGAGHGLLVLTVTRPQFGVAQTADATWKGTAMDLVLNTSDGSSQANDPLLFVHGLQSPASGAGTIDLAFNAAHSDSLVVVVETEGADLDGIVAAYEREGTTSDTTLSGTVTGTGLALAIGGIARGTTASWSAGWDEILEDKSDTGTATSTLTASVASRRAGGETPATVTFADADDGRVLGLLVLPDAGA